MDLDSGRVGMKKKEREIVDECVLGKRIDEDRCAHSNKKERRVP